MARAELGDDVFGEDPTANRLQERTASLLGKAASLFMASGTMSNGVALRCLADPGDEVICGSASHVYNFEGGQHALHGGIQLHRMDETEGGLLPLAEVENALQRPRDPHFAPRTVVAMENTHNMLGGRVLDLKGQREVLGAARRAGASTYLDGARLWHAHLAAGVSLHELAADYDMVSVCFSKAMGCPVGSVLAGSTEMVQRAHWFRKRFGGGMRQIGVLAAACIHSLDNVLPRLGLTHDYARRLASAAASSPALRIDVSSVDSNIVMLRTLEGGADKVVRQLASKGVGSLTVDDSTVRLVTHLSLNEEDVEYAMSVLAGLEV
jgi:threonine aldolase